jgi:hypothetical protein
MPPVLRATVLLPLCAVLGCGDPARRGASVPETSTGGAPAPATVTRQQFAALSWLEGRWAGTMPGGSRFYEGYRFADDSTIRSYNYPDSSSAAPSDSGSITLRGGVVSTGEGAGWVATELSDDRIHFEPTDAKRNRFTWTRRSSDLWEARLAMPGTRDGPKEVVYEMRRQPSLPARPE